MDEINQKILNIIQVNDKISYQELSEKLSMAASTIHNRVKIMEKEGIIKQYSAVVDPFKVGFDSMALIGLSVDIHKMNEIAERLCSFDEIHMVAVASGDHDIIIQLLARDNKELWKFINENIKTIEGVKSKMHVSSYLELKKMNHNIKFKTSKNE
ncbi:MAG: Lrp/AsnC family transcriptional regulator [Promethearchaeota archaeon]